MAAQQPAAIPNENLAFHSWLYRTMPSQWIGMTKLTAMIHRIEARGLRTSKTVLLLELDKNDVQIKEREYL